MSKTGEFYQVQDMKEKHRPMKGKANHSRASNLLLKTDYFLAPQEWKHLRRIYGVTNLLSDLGGVMNVMLTVFGVLFKPLSKHQYFTNAIKRLFLARTKDDTIFLDPKKGKHKSEWE